MPYAKGVCNNLELLSLFACLFTSIMSALSESENKNYVFTLFTILGIGINLFFDLASILWIFYDFLKIFKDKIDKLKSNSNFLTKIINKFRKEKVTQTSQSPKLKPLQEEKKNQLFLC